MRKSILLLSLLAVMMLLPWLSQAQSLNYFCTFEDESDTAGWYFANSSNGWIVDTMVASTGTHSMYISNGGNAHNYTNSSTSFSYAYRQFALEQGSYFLSFDWLANGESSYDFIRVYLVPNSVSLTAGVSPSGNTSSSGQYSTTPAGWIALDGGHGLNLVTSWQSYSYEFDIAATDTFKLVFMWCNDGSAGTVPPGAIDNVLFAQPTCPKPINVALSNITTTSFDFSWHESGEATEWIVELDSAGVTRGQGIREVVYDTTLSFWDLTPNTDYTLWLAAICSSGDTSLWVRYDVTTPCTFLTSIPYYEDFENASASGNAAGSAFLNCWYRLDNGTTYNYPYVGNSTSYSHNGGTRGLYWYSSTTTGTYGDYQCAVLPGIDTDSVAMQTLQITFWAKATSASYRPELYVGVMSNPNDISTFHPTDTIHVSGTEWTKYVGGITGCADSCNYIAVMSRRGTSTWSAYLDEFTIERAPACRQVSGLEVSHVSTASAYLSWEMLGRTAMPSEYIVTVVTADDNTSLPVTYSAAERTYLLTGLQPATRYMVHVDGLCGLDTMTGDSVVLTTASLPCVQMDLSSLDTVLFSNSTSGASGCLAYSSWGNTAYQTIYTAAELAAAGLQSGPITGIDLGFTSCSSYNKELTIWISNSNVTSINTSTLASPANQQLVYGPAVHPVNTSGWQHYEFSEPFVWDGSSSIMITTTMNQYGGSQSSSSGLTGYYVSATNKAAYRYKDSSPFTAADINSGNAGTTYSYRASIHFYTGECLDHATCVAPNVILARNEVDTVSIIWAPGFNENSWDIAYKLEADSDWTVAASGVTESRYDFTAMQPMSKYIIRVIPACGGDSIFAELNITTPCVPVVDLPFTEDFENFIATSSYGSPITDCWFRGTSYPSTGYPYINSSNGLSGTHSMYFYGSTSYYAYLCLPAMAASLDSLQVSFAIRYSTANYGIKVGIMTDPEDVTTFTQIDEAVLQNANTWEMFEIPFSGYEGEGGYITFMASGATYLYLDNIEVDYIPSCPRPSHVTIPNPQQNSAVAHWVDSVHNEFEIEYGLSGFAHGHGILTSSNCDSVGLYGLSHSTRYDVYVRAICGAGDTSNWSFVSSFVTACGVIDTLPWHDNFSAWGVGTTARPACWTSGGYSSYPYIQNVTNGDGDILRQTYNLYSYNTTPTYFSLPELDSATYPIHNMQVIFKAWSANFSSTSYTHDLVVGVCSTPGSFADFTPVDTIQLTAQPLEYEVSFENAYGAGKYITFFSYKIDPSSSAYYNYAYVDSVAIEEIPDCQAPNNLVPSLVQTYSADAAWHDRANTAQWQIEYGPRGFVLGTGIRATTTSNPYTMTGLLPACDYDYYVRAICGIGDTSAWSRTPGRFSTHQNPAPVPYTWNCEDDAEWTNWQTSSNKVTINWARGSAAGNGTNGFTTDTSAIYISTDGGATFGTNADDSIVNAACYRDFDFGPGGNSFRLSFRAKVGGTVNNGYDALVTLLVDPDVPVTSTDANLTSPWGDIREIPTLVQTHYVPNWNTYTAYLDTLTGIHRIAFFWFNQATNSTDYPFRGGAAAVDDIKIEVIDCPRPAGIVASNTTMSSTDLSWNGDPNSTYYVTYRSLTDASTLVNDTCYTNHLRLSNLNPGSRYQVNIVRQCNDSLNSTMSLPGYFTTLVCNGGLMDTIGSTTNTTTTYYLPANNYYKYSYTQQIVTAQELGGAGEISSISFNYAYSAAPNKTNCTIYMAHTSQASFASADNFVTTENMQVVYTGRINPSSAGWYEIHFQNPFNYNGTDNLVIAVDDNTNGYASTSYTYYVDQTGIPMSICYFSDSENIDASADTALSAFAGTKEAYAYRNQMSLTLCPENPCPLPDLLSPRVRSDEVTIHWPRTASRYAISYRREATSSWVADNLQVEDTFYTIHNLYPNTEYVYRVRQYCDSTGLSNWAYGRFNTGEITCLPPDSIWVTSISHDRVSLKWSTDDSFDGFTLHIYNGGYDREINSVTRTKTVKDLAAGETYYAQVRANCLNTEQPSDYGEPIAFTTPVCSDATNLVASDVQGNSVVLDWNVSDDQHQWAIEFGYAGFSQGDGFEVIADTHPFTLTNLTGETTYDIYVRALCGDNWYSEHWSNCVTITTLYSGIEAVGDDSRVLLYPNPTSSDVELLLPGQNGAVRVEILDLTGRVRQSYQWTEGERHTLSTSDLSQGAYFVRIAGQTINTVKKLVVK